MIFDRKEFPCTLTREVALMPFWCLDPPVELISDPSGVYLGRTRNMKKPVFWTPQKLINPHVVIFGTTGSGKTSTARTLLLRAMYWYEPPPNILIIDCVGEYARYVEAIPGGKVYHVGSRDFINPLDTPADDLRAKIAQFISLAIDSGFVERRAARQIAVLRQAVELAYRLKGITSSEDLRDPTKQIPTLQDVLEALERMSTSEGETAERKSVAETVYERLYNVAAQTRAFERGTSVDITKLFTSGVVCLNLHPLPTEQARTMIAILVLQYLVSWMRRLEETTRIRLFVLLDEAHQVFSVKFEEGEHPLVILYREGRKYGVSCILSSQLIRDFSVELLANTGTILMMRVHPADANDVQKKLWLQEHIVRAAMDLPQFNALAMMSFRTTAWNLPFWIEVEPYFLRFDLPVKVRRGRNLVREWLESVSR